MKKISIITGVYNEEETISEVYLVIKDVFECLKGRYDYEHIFLDNCSTDSSLTMLKEIAKKDGKVKILSYSKNFGPIKSEYVGYAHASGDAVIAYEANLKDPPEMILDFIREWENGHYVVYGIRKKTQDNFVMRFMRRLFYKLCSTLFAEPLPENAGSFRLMDRKVVDEIIKLDDYKPHMRGIIANIGFKQKGIVYERRARAKGKSKSNINYLVDFAINAFVSYSVIPIRICTYLGIFLLMASIIMTLGYIVLKLLYWKLMAPGVASIIVLILFFSGIQLFFLGVIGEYVGAIHSQVRKKPFVVIKEKVNIK